MLALSLLEDLPQELLGSPIRLELLVDLLVLRLFRPCMSTVSTCFELA